MKEVIIATQNSGKAKEFEHIFNRYNIQVKSFLDLGDVTEIEENGETFEENALIIAEVGKKSKVESGKPLTHSHKVWQAPQKECLQDVYKRQLRQKQA